jgi:hypothetical protein
MSSVTVTVLFLVGWRGPPESSAAFEIFMASIDASIDYVNVNALADRPSIGVSVLE